MGLPRHLALWALLLTTAARAQSSRQNAGQSNDARAEGVDAGNYNIRQSVEVGWRWRDFSGSEPVFDTLVDLHSGPRLLEQSLEMRSLNQHGLLFDTLSWRSLGYGGDPNALSRLRLDKNRWYNFAASFRRDENFWDYNLLANPLNSPASAPFVPIDNSPHRFHTVRRAGDYSLLLRPQSRVRFRLGYQRQASQGPSFTSFHAGTDQGAETVIFQPWRTLQNSYQIGADLKLLPRTSISYDQFLQYEKEESSQADRNFNFQLANGQPVDLGVVFNSPFVPCAMPIVSAGNPPVANAACNGFLSYTRAAPQRARVPTERLTFQSSYFRRLELAGLISYSSANNRIPVLDDLFQGLVLPLALRQEAVTGSARARRISSRAELGGTWRVTPRFRVSDSFRYSSFRSPGVAATLENDGFASSLLLPAVFFNAADCPAPFTSASCPAHTLGSPPDAANVQIINFLGQTMETNRLNLEYDLSRHFGGVLGYGYRNREINQRGVVNQELVFFPPLANRGACLNQPRLPDGSCVLTTSEPRSRQTLIHEHSVWLDLWSRALKNDALRMDLDLELLAADNFFTRLDPRQMQKYRARILYRPAPWASLGATAKLEERRNGSAGIDAQGHNRSYTWNALLSPGEKWTLDLNYNYDSVFSRAAICFVSSVLPPGTVACATDPALLGVISVYQATTHFGHAGILWRPVPRVTTGLGYSITSADGRLLQLDPNAPPGPLRFNYHQPAASLTIALGRGLSWKADWGYYGYGEKGSTGPLAARDFHGNLATVGLRYEF